MKKKERGRRNGQESFSQDRHTLLAMPYQDFPGCQDQLKALLRVSPGILYAPNVLVVIILGRSILNYPSVAPIT
jgi:hypothetical protein